MAQARQASLRTLAIIGAGTALAQALASAGPLLAALFACTEGPGITIVTDSPTQLSQCRLLSEHSPATRGGHVPLPVPPPAVAPLPTSPAERSPLASPSMDHTARPASVSVPLERIGSLFVVTIQVNQTRSARLILDTGASHTILSRAIARDLGLFSLRPVAAVTMQTVGGAVQADMVQVDSIRIAGAEVRNSTAAIYDLPDVAPDIEGLLGLSVLRQFEVTLDTARNRLHLGLPQP